MNRKRKFTSIVLAGALFCGIAGTTFVGCKDYDGDIDGLNERVSKNEQDIAANKKAIEDIQSLLKTGVVLTKVESDGNGGVKLTLSNGQTFNIEKGAKGDQGVQGVQGIQGPQGPIGPKGDVPAFSIQGTDLIAQWSDGTTTNLGTVVAQVPNVDFEIKGGNLFYNGKDLGKVVGEAGEAGKTPNLDFKIEGDHLWLYVEGVKTKDLGKVIGADGNTPTMPGLEFKIDEEGYLLYKLGEDAWKQVGNQKVVGKDGEGVTAADFKFEIHEGKLYVNPNADYTEGEIGSVVAGVYSVNAKGELCVNGTSTGVKVNGSIFMTKTASKVTLNMPVVADDGTVTYESVALPTLADYELVKGRLQSVVYVPATADKMVHSYSLEGGIQAEKITVNFKIYPETFDLGTAVTDGKAIIKMDAQELKTRSTELLKDLKVAKGGEAGVWTVTASKNGMIKDGYAAALVITYNEATVSSDYFTIDNKTITETEMNAAIFGAGDTRNIAFNSTEGIILPAAEVVNGFEVAYTYEIMPEAANRAASLFSIDKNGKLTLTASDQKNVGSQCKVKVIAKIGEKSFERVYTVEVTTVAAQISSIVLTKATGAKSYYLTAADQSFIYPEENGNMVLSYKVFPNTVLTSGNIDFDVIGEGVEKNNIEVLSVAQKAGITSVTFKVNTKNRFQIACGIGNVYSAYTEVTSTEISTNEIVLAEKKTAGLGVVTAPIEVIWKNGSYDLKNLVVVQQNANSIIELANKGFKVNDVTYAFKNATNPNFKLQNGVVTPKEDLEEIPTSGIEAVINATIKVQDKKVKVAEVTVKLVKADNVTKDTIVYEPLNKVIGVTDVDIKFANLIDKIAIMNSLGKEVFNQENWKIMFGKSVYAGSDINIIPNNAGVFSAFPIVTLKAALKAGTYIFTNNYYVVNDDGSQIIQPVKLTVHVAYPTKEDMVKKEETKVVASLDANGHFKNDLSVVLNDAYTADYEVVFVKEGSAYNLINSTFSLPEIDLGASKSYKVTYKIQTKSTHKELHVCKNAITVECKNPFNGTSLTDRSDGLQFVDDQGQIVTFKKTTSISSNADATINLLENISLKDIIAEKEVIKLGYSSQGKYFTQILAGYGVSVEAKILDYTANGASKIAKIEGNNFKWIAAITGDTPFEGKTFTVRITVKAPYAPTKGYTKDLTIEVKAQQ